MSNLFESTKPAEIARFIGKHFFYTYEDGWQYEMYIKNDRAIRYRIHGSIVGERWVRNQQTQIVRISDDVVKISWDEPTGTTVSVAVNFAECRLHGVIFSPQRVAQAPEKTVCFQNDHLDPIRENRNVGSTYPKLVIDEYAPIAFLEDRGASDETVIASAPKDLPIGYADRLSLESVAMLFHLSTTEVQTHSGPKPDSHDDRSVEPRLMEVRERIATFARLLRSYGQ